MTELHAALGLAAAAGVIAVVVASGAMAAGLAGSRRWLDRAILVQLAAAAAVVAAGLAVAVGTRAPSDPLHLLYGGVLAVAPVAARYATRTASARQMGRTVLVVAVVTLGVTVRAFMTGG